MSTKIYSDFYFAEVLVEHGRLWLLVGSIRLRLILPLDECDPVTKYGYKCDHIRNQLHNLNLEIEVLKLGVT